MRLTKSLLCGVAALLLAAGSAFADEASEFEMMAPEAMAAEEEVIYLVPLEVTEYYLIIPQSPELG